MFPQRLNQKAEEHCFLRGIHFFVENMILKVFFSVLWKAVLHILSLTSRNIYAIILVSTLQPKAPWSNILEDIFTGLLSTINAVVTSSPQLGWAMLYMLQGHETLSGLRELQNSNEGHEGVAVIMVLKSTEDDFSVMESELCILESKQSTGTNFICKTDTWMSEPMQLSLEHLGTVFNHHIGKSVLPFICSKETFCTSTVGPAWSHAVVALVNKTSPCPHGACS